ncbi:hypothetical protein ABG79_00349 [Caloramator mitchellensis]|uniref:Selenium-dependent hydroxylase accessory protein YqeC n=1 Tax=Caloramator mitchellensis TaxID=908809 RepID=A0A0R3K2K0_CALMK|nr:selenium cofactor biosynthesis protein YqeC [Caloramator mitchellensis]KRQ87548.1 hypothetical protein ABG79_00349 [Caloramator mitchellensis]
MNIVEKLGINNEVITIVGGGGKTSIMFKIASELKSQNKRVLVTTTTKMYYPTEGQCDQYFNFDDFDIKNIKCNIIVVCKEVLRQDKVLGLDVEQIKHLLDLNIFDACIIEGDGSRGISIKAPEEFEPVVPIFSKMVIGVIGADALYKEINDKNVFRVVKFCKVTGSNKGDLLDEKVVSKLINSDNGLFKETPSMARKIAVINKVDDEYKVDICKKIFSLTDCEFAISSIKNDLFEKWR